MSQGDALEKNNIFVSRIHIRSAQSKDRNHLVRISARAMRSQVLTHHKCQSVVAIPMHDEASRPRFETIMTPTRTTEEQFLNDRIGTFVSVYLITGIRLTGTLQGHDSDAVFLRPHGGQPFDDQMIFKLAISTIASV